MLRWLLVPLFAFAAVDKSISRKALSDFHDGTGVLLDVRENDEVAAGRVKGSLTFPKSRVGSAQWDKFVASLHKEKPIYVYCRTGRRSEEVVKELRAKGFAAENAGGLSDLQKEGAETQ